MKDHMNKLWMLAIILPLTLLQTACQQEPEAVAEAPEIQELVVLTPHAQPIRDAFAERFSLWHEKMYGQPRSIRWIYRGTVDAQRYLYELYAEGAEPRLRRTVDVFFGGGLPIHRDIVSRGYALPIKVPENVLSGIPSELNGQPLYASDGSWFGTALSGFGILYNKPACQVRSVPAPTTWADLAQPAYRGWVAAADPALSGSTAECLVLILLKHGWDEGWGLVNGLLANCDGLSPSSSHIGPNVLCGIAVAGLQAEFVAHMMVATAPETLEYVSPPSATAVTPDPVIVLKDAPHPAAAAHFVEFVLTPEGQALWALPADMGGPSGEPLYRYPIRPDIYQKHGDKLVVKGNPFTEKSDFKIDPEDEAAYTQLLPHITNAACGANHLLMQRAWEQAWKEGPQSAKLATLREPPFSKDQALAYAQECAKSSQRASHLESEWSNLFRKRYQAVLGIASAPALSAAQ
jgi:ABC-type Fe3+ transport system substrate-binding protein